MGLSVVILAAGTGSRLNSNTPKVLQKLGGKYLITHVLDTVEKLGPDEIFIVRGHMGDKIRRALPDRKIKWVEQEERLGTGHAVRQVLPYINPENKVLILCGDVPLISYETLRHFVDVTSNHHLGLLAAKVDNPFGLGRIVRDEYKEVTGIVEEKDATDLEKQINEINTGIYCVPCSYLSQWLPKLSNENAQGEYYLTEIIKFARKEGLLIQVASPISHEEILGVNTRAELAKLERIYQKWLVESLMAQGVTVSDPARVDIRGSVNAGKDCYIDVGVVFEGEVTLGERCKIGPYTVLKDVDLADDVTVYAFSHLQGANVDNEVQIGPYARLREGTDIKEGARIGNFVEVKKTKVGKGVKANHLTYLGNSTIGEYTNIGAGTITCNYDGVNKHQTTIGDYAFIGSGTQLVAPVSIGDNATVGAGSTITKTVPADQLGIARGMQKNLTGWKRPEKKKTEEVV